MMTNQVTFFATALLAASAMAAPSQKTEPTPNWKCPDSLPCAGSWKPVQHKQEADRSLQCLGGDGFTYGCSVSSSGSNCWGGCAFPTYITGQNFIRCPGRLKCDNRLLYVNTRQETASSANCVVDGTKQCILRSGADPECSPGCSIN